MAQATIDMCDHIIRAADKGERFPLTVNEMRQLAYLARQVMRGGEFNDIEVDSEGKCRWADVAIAGDQATREIKWLRAMLHSLTRDPPATLDEPDTDADVIVKMRAKINQALSWDGGYSPHPSGERDRP